MTDPFAVLGLDEQADDEAVKQRYLACVRAFPPERAPERFQEFRAAYEAVRTERDRLALRLLKTSDAALQRLKQACLAPAGPGRRPSRVDLAAVFLDGLASLPAPGGEETR